MSIETDIVGMMSAVRATIREHELKEENAGNDLDKLDHKLQARYWAGYLNGLEDVQALMKRREQK